MFLIHVFFFGFSWDLLQNFLVFPVKLRIFLRSGQPMCRGKGSSFQGVTHVDTLATLETCGSQFWEPDGPSPPKLGITRIIRICNVKHGCIFIQNHIEIYWNHILNHAFTTTLDLEDTGKPKSHRHIVRSCRLRWNGDKPIQRHKCWRRGDQFPFVTGSGYSLGNFEFGSHPVSSAFIFSTCPFMVSIFCRMPQATVNWLMLLLRTAFHSWQIK